MDQRRQDQNFFPKNLAKKLERVLQWRISGTARVRVRSCSTPPPFRADEKHPGGLFSAGIPAAFRRCAPTVSVARCGITNFSLHRHAGFSCRFACGMWVDLWVRMHEAEIVHSASRSADQLLQTPIVATPFFKTRACLSSLLHPAPPFVQMKNTPGVLPEGRVSRRGIRRAR